MTVTIPEGYSAPQIGELLEKNGVCSKSDFLLTLNTYDFTYYSLIAAIQEDKNRCYKLEGYLFPDTYNFNLDKPVADAVGVLLRGAESKINGVFSHPDLTTDQLVILASLIEKEAAGTEDMRKVSSVFHNRLNAGMRLQSDATIHYVERYLKPNLTGDIDRYNSFYNTYKCEALPAGPICNPSVRALRAAAEPAETDYLYFAADSEGKFYYAATYEEHLRNCEKAGIQTGGGEE